MLPAPDSPEVNLVQKCWLSYLLYTLKDCQDKQAISAIQALDQDVAAHAIVLNNCLFGTSYLW